MLVLSFVFGTFAAVFFCFTIFCVKHYASLCMLMQKQKRIFMQCIMVNRKRFGNFEFSAHLQKRSIFLLFVSLLFLLFWIIYRKRKQKRKSRFLWCFCPKTSVFDANNILIFSVLYLYRQTTPPHPRFWHSQSGSALFRKFFIFFYFLFFVKYSDFSNSAFLPNFEHFPKHHIYF